MKSEQQYIDLYEQARQTIFDHAPETMNACRDQAFADFKRVGLPSRSVERYKYTDLQQLFAPDYGLNLNRLPIPVEPYKAFRCDVPNLSTALFFVVNDSIHTPQDGGTAAHRHLPEGMIVDSLSRHQELASRYYARLASTADDGVTALNTMLAQDALLIYVPRHVQVAHTVQVLNILRSDVDLMVNRRVLIVV